MKRTPICLVTLVWITSPAFAQIAYAPSADPGRVVAGTGGQHFRRNGIDWWTSGAPPRSFAVVGLVTDERDSLVLSGHALGSAAIANLARGHGADAIVLHDTTDIPVCLPRQVYTCRHGRVRGHAEGVVERITHLEMIKYV